MSTLAPFKRLVHQRCGLHLEGLAEARLARAITLINDLTGIYDPETLLARLKQDSTLFDRFVSQLTVNETYFFREPEVLHWLTDTYLPRQLAKKQAPLRLLSAGCSSGEEPYSIAMALLERYGERAKQLFQINGGDVDHQVLNKAQAGIYSGMAFRALSTAFKARYFSPIGRSFQLVEALRQWVTFRHFNLLAPGKHELEGPFDVILFRNVSIYFDETTRRAIQQHLKQLLAPGGIVLCGVTETMGNDLGVLSLVEDQGIFYFQAQSSATTQPTNTHRLAPTSAEPVVGPESAPYVPFTPQNNSVEHSPAPHAEPPLSCEHETAARGTFYDELRHAHELLNQNHFSNAAHLLTPLLAEQPWCVDALLLAGLVARWQQQPQQAFDYFKRALYVAPDCWPAHFYQAELLRQGELPDNPAQRQRGYAAVVRLLEASPQANGGLKEITPPIPPGDACFLAKRYLNKQTAIQGVG
ncbi:CheR family methyltransferase [Vreelandella lionensis]|uniref:CheR family methyltransferase n=1 Tax=Vreelandella lionensis TaxID=1144478 RepID=A0ABW8BX52_9GAMM